MYGSREAVGRQRADIEERFSSLGVHARALYDGPACPAKPPLAPNPLPPPLAGP